MKKTLIILWCVGFIFLSACDGASSGARLEMEEATINELQAAMEAGDVTAVEVTQAYLNRIVALDPRLNSILEVNPDALAIAARLDDERAAGNVRSPLHGIPVLLKDNIDTADEMLTTAGSLALVNAPAPAQDAFLVQQLRAAGAIILGKTNLSEWANFRSTMSSSGWSARGGQTRNPYLLDRTPCGSSSGSAVAVAANLTMVAVGTETDGSVVCPASNNGIVGIKPTLGLVSRSGIIPIAHSQDTAGPMARTVTDAVLLLNAMLGADEGDAVTAEAPQPTDYSRFLDSDGLRGKRIGVLRQFFGRNPRTDALMEAQLEVLKAGGAQLVDVEIPTLNDAGGPEFQVLLYEFKHDLNQYLSGRGGAHRTLADLIQFNKDNAAEELRYFGQELFEQAQAKGDLESDEYREALQQAKSLTQAQGVDAVIEEHNLDALVAPTNSTGWMIDLINGDSPNNYISSSRLAAVAGYPNITVPAGFIKELPIGISFIGPAFSEPTLIAVAYAYEQRSQARKPPKFLPTYQ